MNVFTVTLVGVSMLELLGMLSLRSPLAAVPEADREHFGKCSYSPKVLIKGQRDKKAAKHLNIGEDQVCNGSPGP